MFKNIPLEDILKDRVKYGFLAIDDDDDVRTIVASELYHEEHGFDPSQSDPKQIELLRQAAKEYNARKTVTFRPQARVLASFQMRANREGIPYQALLNSVMKKYAEG